MEQYREQRIKEDKEARTNVYEKVANAKNIADEVYILYRGGEIVKYDFRKDSDSFEYLGDGYSKDSTAVYYGYNREIVILDWADSRTFEVIPHSGYGKDKNNVFFATHKIEDVDIETFEVLASRRAKDKNHHYRLSQKVEPYDKPFNNIANTQAQDLVSLTKKMEKEFIPNANKITELSNEFYSYKDNIFYIPYDTREQDKIKHVSEESDIDFNSFEILNRSYAKDVSSIYYINTGYSPQGMLQVMESADHSSFSVIDRYYAKDKNNVYHLGKMRENIDPSTFIPE
ncbi:DKNYY domain-containing protein [Candidatus Gracilibacteria bacterium]|nr:DKNYY domain-containing protein [Candidatus Gracilibacteria bacterium]